ncbi:hypothetical protein SERLA73DRAFT_71651 [Serpula lacrymans var. lacrymans S7.3]|uniref:Reverse transcriptase RNase H-like domain-containing protein n=1 Tax=Serpula lacrymans var. lacrymans (strain S7.3) TaxID=936435 RepID=F8PRY7_SERL3|nr:hypothetical protein SERLA73DRAFT_71651 [Serpula lacrymans var. lacrymans S7.3]
MDTLARYDFRLEHVKGSANTKADLLSQRIDHPRGERDNEGQVLLPQLAEANIYTMDDVLEEHYLDELLASQHKLDDYIVKKLKDDPKVWKKHNGIIWIGNKEEDELTLGSFKNNIYVPKDPELRARIIEEEHLCP